MLFVVVRVFVLFVVVRVFKYIQEPRFSPSLACKKYCHLHAWIDDITCCCKGPHGPLRGGAGLQRKIVSKICEKFSHIFIVFCTQPLTVPIPEISDPNFSDGRAFSRSLSRTLLRLPRHGAVNHNLPMLPIFS